MIFCLRAGLGITDMLHNPPVWEAVATTHALSVHVYTHPWPRLIVKEPKSSPRGSTIVLYPYNTRV